MVSESAVIPALCFQSLSPARSARRCVSLHARAGVAMAGEWPVDVLEKIVAEKRREIETARRERPFESLVERLPAAPPVRDFAGALRAGAGMRVICEVKKAS